MRTEFHNVLGHCIRSELMTKFTHVLVDHGKLEHTKATPKDWENVLLLAVNETEGDIFKAWDNINPIKSVIYFGKAGYEFDDSVE